MKIEIFEASAGTGKTYTLCEKIVGFINDGLNIGSLLVVTFTENAAIEIKQKVRARLMDEQKENPESKIINEAIINFDTATITTIHGFFTQILKSDPEIFDLPLGISIDNSSQETDFILKRLCHKYIEDFIQLKSPISLEELLQFYAGEKNVFSTLIELASSILVKNYDDKNLYRHDALKVSDLDMGFCIGYLESIFVQNPQLERKFDSLLEFHNFPSFAGIEVIEIEPLVNLIFHTLAFNIIKEYRAIHNSQIIKNSKLDFDDIISVCFEKIVIENNEQINAEISSRFEAILIDEFQDTDAKQWRIFKSLFLGKPKTKFFIIVGDAKQSIYSFRGGDQNVYRKAIHELQNEFGAEVKRLDTCYRSVAKLTEANNQLFTHFSSWFNKLEPINEWQFEDLKPKEENGEDKPFKIITISADKKFQGVQSVTKILLKEIFSLSQNRKLSDIAILFENNDLLTVIALELKRAGYAIKIQGKKSLTTSRFIDIIFFLCKALSNPDDLSPYILLSQSEVFSHLGLSDFRQFLFDVRKIYAVQGMIGIAELLTKRMGDQKSITDIRQICTKLHEFGADGKTPIRELDRLSELFKEKLSTELTDALERDSSQDAITLMTMHGSKGLTFKVVFSLFLNFGNLGMIKDSEAIQTYDENLNRHLIIGAPKGSSSHKRVIESAFFANINQAYVGLTRAAETQYLIAAGKLTAPQRKLAQNNPEQMILPLALFGKDERLTPMPREAYTSDFIDFVHYENPSIDRPSTQLKNKESIQLQTTEVADFVALERFPPKERHPYNSSYTTLSPEHEHVNIPLDDLKDTLPAGPHFGDFYHVVLEELTVEELDSFARDGNFREKVVAIAERKSFHKQFEKFELVLRESFAKLLQLTLPHGEILIDFLKAGKVYKEVAFLGHLIPRIESFISKIDPDSQLGKSLGLRRDISIHSGFLNGIIDLFRIKDETIYIIDWKTNRLNEDLYNDLEIVMIPPHSAYKFQALLYTLILSKLFPKYKIGGTYYIFTRKPVVYNLKIDKDELKELENILNLGQKQELGGISWM